VGREQIKVELIDHMGSDLSTVNSARVSFDKESDWDIIEHTGGNTKVVGELRQGDERLIKYLASHKHLTPFRHNAIQIRCHAPIFLARQLGKHQAGLSWNEVSRRYVDSEPEFFIPDEWRGRPDGSIKQGSGGTLSKDVNDSYESMVELIRNEYTNLLLLGVAPEMARMVLPQSMMTSWYWTGNLLSFAHVYKERKAEGAQLEAQWFAEELDKVIRPLFRESWSALVD
jgi:thymidylate synthase (FAD)